MRECTDSDSDSDQLYSNKVDLSLSLSLYIHAPIFFKFRYINQNVRREQDITILQKRVRYQWDEKEKYIFLDKFHSEETKTKLDKTFDSDIEWVIFIFYFLLECVYSG